jgi:hypothetical protein
MIARLASFILLAALLAGCTRNEPLALHGAGMMRVEVEVYKGPLSVPPSAQMGELVAVMSDAIRANVAWRAGAQALMGQLGCGAAGDGTGPAGDCAALQGAADSAEDAIGAGCYIFDTPAMRDLVALATYLPHGTCGEYAGAWRHIEERRGRYDEAMNRALSAVERKVLIDAAHAVKKPAEEAERARASVAKANSPAEKATSEAALKAAQQALEQALASFDKALIAALREGSGGPTAIEPLPTLYDVFARASVCALPDDIADALAGSDGEPRSKWPTPLTNNLRCEHEAVVVAVQNMASVLRAAGFRSSFGNVRYVSHDQRVRAQLAAFAFMAGEYGNQLQSRIAVLAKQLAQGVDPANLAMGDYLRDTSNTDAIYLFDWLKASDDPHGVAPPGGLTPADRVRMVERLTSDYYWKKINDVYASGQGDVAMAFIKDDIGNWNLKSFSNAPGKLLKAYRGAANAAIVSAAKLATKAANPAGASALAGTDKLLSLARQFATGRVEGDSGTGQSADTLLVGLNARIEAQRAQFATLKASLDKDAAGYPAKIEEAKAAAEKAKSDEDAAFRTYNDERAKCTADPCAGRDGAYDAYAKRAAERAAADRALEAVTKAQTVTAARLDGLPKEAAQLIQRMIDDERVVIDALQKAALPAATPTPAPAAVPDAAGVAGAAKAVS